VSADGLILTNRHVIEDCQVITVEGLGAGMLKAVDRGNDLALVKVEGSSSPVTFRSTPVEIGESVFATGYPYGGLLGSGLHFTNGLVSSLTGIENDSRFLQFTAPVQPGNSGGPLLDESGLVVGVVSGRLDDIAVLKASGSLPQNVNFGIHGALATSFLRANDVDPIVAPSTGALEPSEIAKNAKPHTFRLSCLSGSSPTVASSVDRSDRPPISLASERAAKAAAEYFRTWSLDNQEALAFLDDIYPSQAYYYGKVSSKAAIMNEKQEFAERWPVRSYSIEPGTVNTSCEADFCTVSGVVDWRTYSATRGATSIGSARFHLRFTSSGPLMLLSESGEVLARKVERGRR
jgi:Trypsin-like peptidase domain